MKSSQKTEKYSGTLFRTTCAFKTIREKKCFNTSRVNTDLKIFFFPESPFKRQ
jgi:hypothetical protein